MMETYASYKLCKTFRCKQKHGYLSLCLLGHLASKQSAAAKLKVWAYL